MNQDTLDPWRNFISTLVSQILQALKWFSLPTIRIDNNLAKSTICSTPEERIGLSEGAHIQAIT